MTENTTAQRSTLTPEQIEALTFLFKKASPADKKALLDLFITPETITSVADTINDHDRLYLAVITDGTTRLLGLVVDQDSSEDTILAEVKSYLAGRIKPPAPKKAPRKPTDRRRAKK